MKRLVIAAVCLLALAMAVGASASGTGTIPFGSVLTIQAESNGNAATYLVDPLNLLGLGAADGSMVEIDNYLWSLAPGKSISLASGGKTLGTIKQLEIGLVGDPVVTLRFSVDSNDSSTVWTFTSTTVSFAALTNPAAYASAAMTVTSDADGAQLTGQFGGKAYQARYNGSSVFANLVDPITAPGDNSVTGSERSPGTGWGSIAGSVTSIESEFRFTLTAGDSASGTSRFEVVPEPTGLVALAAGLASLGGLLARKRRG